MLGPRARAEQTACLHLCSKHIPISSLLFCWLSSLLPSLHPMDIQLLLQRAPHSKQQSAFPLMCISLSYPMTSLLPRLHKGLWKPEDEWLDFVFMMAWKVDLCGRKSWTVLCHTQPVPTPHWMHCMTELEEFCSLCKESLGKGQEKRRLW